MVNHIMSKHCTVLEVYHPSVANKVLVKTKKTMIHYKYYCEFYTQILTPIHCCSICFLGPVPTLPGIVTACCNLK